MALAGSYLDVEEFKARTIAPASLVDGARTRDASAWKSYVESRLKIATSRINARLTKRYAVPFSAPYVEIVLGWVTAIVTPELYEKAGWAPSDAQAEKIYAAAERAEAEIKEAADAEEGLYELPLRADTTETGVTKGGPLGYSEADPYAWIDLQRDALS